MKIALAFAIAAGSLGVTQTIVPVDKEPQHHLAFEDESVRVLDILFPPGYVTLFHRHSLDNVGIKISGGATRIDQLDAEGSPRNIPPGDVTFFSGTPPYTHLNCRRPQIRDPRGIRLSEHGVPTSTNTGDNSGGQGCVTYGSYQPFESARLRELYPTHAAYVTAVKVATDANVRAGYLLLTDAERTVREAQESQVGSR